MHGGRPIQWGVKICASCFTHSQWKVVFCWVWCVAAYCIILHRINNVWETHWWIHNLPICVHMCKQCMLTSKSQILFESHPILMQINSKIHGEYIFWYYFSDVLKFNILIVDRLCDAIEIDNANVFVPGTKTSLHCFFFMQHARMKNAHLTELSTSNIIFFHLSLEHISNIAKCTAINCESSSARMCFSLIQFVMHYITGIESVPCVYYAVARTIRQNPWWI